MTRKKENGKRERHGISVRKFNIFMCIFAVVVSAVMFFVMQRTSKLYYEARELSDNMFRQTRYAHDMQYGSDYLTEMIRSFVITGDKEYLDNYFTEATVTMRRENALKVIGETNSDSPAYDNLEKALEESVTLMQTEYHAAKLAALGYGFDLSEFPTEVADYELSADETSLSPTEKTNRAIELLFDENYKNKKESITSNMQGCLKELTESLAKEQSELFSQLRIQVMLEHILTIILIVILLLIVIISSSQVFYPLKQSLEYIRNEKEMPLRGAYEIRFIAKNYNLMTMAEREKKEKLIYEASHDNLTGLFNRRGYEYLLKNIDIETSALLMVDLDKFKTINDTYGHDIGDKILVRVSNALYKQFKDDCYVCRLGGDEFVMVMIHANKNKIPVIEDRVRAINEKLNVPQNDVPGISISVGVSFGSKGKKINTVFKEADTALYTAKENGRSDVAFYGISTP